MLYFNGTKINKLTFNAQTVGRAFFNGTQVFASEESIIPTWSLSGTGWVNTTWGSWSVGRDEGDLLLGIAEASIQTNGHSKMRFTPTGTGWFAGRSRGAIRILINGSVKFSLAAEDRRTLPVEIDLTGYSGAVTVRVELQADWGYTSMPTATALTLHD